MKKLRSFLCSDRFCIALSLVLLSAFFTLSQMDFSRFLP